MDQALTGTQEGWNQREEAAFQEYNTVTYLLSLSRTTDRGVNPSNQPKAANQVLSCGTLQNMVLDSADARVKEIARQ